MTGDPAVVRTLRSRCVCAILGLAAAVSMLPARALGASLVVSSASAQPSTFAEISIGLVNPGARVVGLQLDLFIDPEVATFSLHGCRANPDSGKTLHRALLPQLDNVLRLILLSFGDVDPIPDGTFATCSILVSPHAQEGTYPIVVSNLQGSDARGNRVAIDFRGRAEIYVDAFGPQLPTPTPRPEDPSSPRDDDRAFDGSDAAATSGGSSCSIVADPVDRSHASWLALPLLVWLVVRRRETTRR